MKKTFKIIDSTYGPLAAKEVLLSLLNDKIRFLGHQIFSLQVRYGEDTSHLERRVSELTAAKQEIIEMVRELEHEKLEISCDVNIRIKQPEPVLQA